MLTCEVIIACVTCVLLSTPSCQGNPSQQMQQISKVRLDQPQGNWRWWHEFKQKTSKTTREVKTTTISYIGQWPRVYTPKPKYDLEKKTPQITTSSTSHQKYHTGTTRRQVDPTTAAMRWGNLTTDSPHETERRAPPILRWKGRSTPRENLGNGSIYCKNKCYNLHGYIDCRNKYCEAFPSDIMPRKLPLYRVNLRSNNIMLIPSRLSISHLQTLDVSWNKIKRLEVENFMGCSELRTLALEHNLMSFIDRLAFQNLRHLRYLSLSFNYLGYIDLLVFNSLDELRILNLGHNKLSHLHLNAMNSLTSLEELFLNNNLLTEIQYPFNVPALKRLHLQDNMIRMIAAGMFLKVSSLEYLDLSNNGLLTFYWDTWSGLHNLQELNVEGSKLSELTYSSFAGDLQKSSLTSLTIGGPALTSISRDSLPQTLISITISDTLISRLHSGIFDDITCLDRINIVNNPNLYDIDGLFTHIDHQQRVSYLNVSFNAFEDLYWPERPDHRYDYRQCHGKRESYSRYMEFDGQGNKWACDRSLEHLRNVIDLNTYDRGHRTSILCASPPHLRGRALSELGYKDLGYAHVWRGKIKDWFIVLYQKQEYWVIVGCFGLGLGLLITIMCCAICCACYGPGCCCRCCRADFCCNCCRKNKSHVSRRGKRYQRLLEVPTPSLETIQVVEHQKPPTTNDECETDRPLPATDTAQHAAEETDQYFSAPNAAPSGESIDRSAHVMFIPEKEILQVFP